MDLRSTVLRVGHHGFYTSTSPAWLEAISPDYAIFSVGADASPSPDVLELLQMTHCSVWQTRYDGTIVLKSNGVQENISLC